jgi:hypothetical protein
VFCREDGADELERGRGRPIEDVWEIEGGGECSREILGAFYRPKRGGTGGGQRRKLLGNFTLGRSRE